MNRKSTARLQVSGSCVEKLETIDWFANVGEPFSPEGEFQIPFTVVDSWESMTRICKRPESDNAFLEARNAITVHLHHRCRDDYQAWNQVTKAAKASLSSSILPSIVAYQHENNLDIEILECARWQLLAFLMEDAYRYCKPPQFFHKLLKVYQMGHFPGGWNGDWPEGELVVY